MKDKYVLVTTGDGSPTYRNMEVDEAYHSHSGALQEAFEKYCKPLRIEEKSNPVIFDICFGIGYNTAAAIDYLLEKGITEANFFCFEKDKQVLRFITRLDPGFKNYEYIQELVKHTNIIIPGTQIKLNLITGDFRESLKKYQLNADYVFFDPFSPKKQPDLWTTSTFSLLHKRMLPGAKLSTYSYARTVRENLEKAGFKVKPGPIIGRRSPSTIATKNN